MDMAGPAIRPPPSAHRSLPSALSLLKQRLRHCFGCWAPPADPLAPGAAPTSPVDMHCELMVMRAEYCLATQGPPAASVPIPPNMER